jgi:hypothetical protein
MEMLVEVATKDSYVTIIDKASTKIKFSGSAKKGKGPSNNQKKQAGCPL